MELALIWLGFGALVPVLIGIFGRSAEAAVGGGTIGVIGASVFPFMPLVGFLIWLAACILSARAVNKRREERLAESRHREIIAALRKDTLAAICAIVLVVAGDISPAEAQSSWLHRHDTFARLVLRANENGDARELHERRMEGPRLLGDVQSLPRPSRLACAQAAQALTNLSSDVLTAQPAPRRAAELSAYREWLPRCRAALGTR